MTNIEVTEKPLVEVGKVFKVEGQYRLRYKLGDCYRYVDFDRIDELTNFAVKNNIKRLELEVF